MDKQNLNEVLLVDLDFYNPSASYVRLLNSKNITTVLQLLKAKSEFNFFKGYSGKTFFQLLGFISMVEYKYLGRHLLCESSMDEQIDIKRNIKDNTKFGTIQTINGDGNQSLVCLDRLFGCPRENAIPVFDEFMEIVNDETLTEKYNISKDDIRVIDFIRWTSLIKNDEFKHIIPYAKAYVESYEQQRIQDIDDKTIKLIKKYN